MITPPAPTLWDRLARLGPGFVDLAVLGGVALCVLADAFALLGTDRTGLRLLAAVATLAAVAARRRFPLGSFGLVIAVIFGLLLLRSVPVLYDYDYPLLSPVAALGAMVTTLVRRQAPAVAIGCGVAGALTIVILLTWPLRTEERVLLSIAFGGIYGVGLGAGIYLRELGRRGSLAAEAARRDERMDLARELHDLVAHHVTGIVIQAQAAQVVADRDPAAAGVALTRIEGAGKEALTAMRRLVGSLREEQGEDGAPVAPPVGLAGLDELTRVTEGTGLAVTLQVTDEARAAAPSAVAASAHRIIQESLTNVGRHAVGATAVTVDVRVDGPDLAVSIVDDGRQAVGGPRSERSGYGLVGMTERAHALGGHLTAGPVDPPAHGWAVQARLPLGGDLP